MLALSVAPLALGAAAPWLLWCAQGRVSAGELAAVSLASATIFLRMTSGSGMQRGGPLAALAICGGITASLVLPGLSAMALIDAVGLPRASGAVRSYDHPAYDHPALAYDHPALAMGGATLALAGAPDDLTLASASGWFRRGVPDAGRVVAVERPAQ
jgi:hypothetical protein